MTALAAVIVLGGAALIGGRGTAFAINSPTLAVTFPGGAPPVLIMAGTSTVNPSATFASSATLSGATAGAGGTVTWKVFNDAGCLNLVSNVTNGSATTLNGAIVAGATSLVVTADIVGTTPLPTNIVLDPGTANQETVSVTAKASTTYTVSATAFAHVNSSAVVTPNRAVISGAVPNSKVFTFAGVGSFYWIAAYSGDPNNNPATSPCTGPITVDAMTGSTLPVFGTIGAGTSMTDTVSLSGLTPGATGTISYGVYTDKLCTVASVTPNGTPTAPVAFAGTAAPASPSYDFTVAGTYYFQANYVNTDGHNGSGQTDCTGQTVSVKAQPYVNSTLTYDAPSPSNPVLIGTTLTNLATISGLTDTATGTVTYKIFSDNACATAPLFTSPATALGTPSSGYEFLHAGNFWAQASYTGDAHNAASTSVCDAAPVVVQNPGTVAVSGPASVTAGTPFNVSIVEGAPVTMAGIATDVLFDGTKLTLNGGGATRGAAWPGPNGNLVPGTLTGAGTAGATLAGAAVAYTPQAGDPVVGGGTREALVLNFTSNTTGPLPSITLANQEMIAACSSTAQASGCTAGGADGSLLSVVPAASYGFINMGAGKPCWQDHLSNLNGDGYSDSDHSTPPGAPACTGVYPGGGGLGTNPSMACPGRAPGSTGAKIAHLDFNDDGAVNGLDLNQLAKYFTQSYTQATDFRAELDVNGDGAINGLDLNQLAKYFTQGVPPC